MRGGRCALKANEEVRSFRRVTTLMHELYKSGDKRDELEENGAIARVVKRKRPTSKSMENE